MESIRPPRRWRPGWRTVLAFVILVCLPSIWFLTSYRTRQTLGRIRALNGMASSTHSFPVPILGGRLQYGPLDDVYLLGPRTDDDALWVLDAVPDLRILDLTNTRITDEGLSRLARFRRLTNLYIVNINEAKRMGAAGARLDTEPLVTGKGLASLKDLPELRVVQLMGSPTTDEDLQALKLLKRLILIDLKDTEVTDEGIADLRKALPGCKITRR